MCHDTEEWCKIWRKTNLLFQKWQKFGEFWSVHSKVSKICTLIGPFCEKYMTCDLKKYRVFIFHDTEESCKIWTILTCGLENDMRNLANFYQNTWNCQNWYFHGILLSKVENAWAKNLPRNNSCNATEEWWSKEELTCRFKSDIKNLMNFDSGAGKSQNFTI